MKTIFLFILVSSLSFAQVEISVGYCKPNIPHIKSLNGVYANCFFETSNKSNFSLKIGAEFNYQFGNYSEVSKQLGKIYDSDYKIYKYEADIKLSYEKYFITPLFNSALGIERYNRNVKYSPRIIDLLPLHSLNKNSLFIKFALGIDIKIFKGINIGTSYDLYFLGYDNSNTLDKYNNAISNIRESLNLFLLYNL